MDFNEREIRVAEELEVECLQASLTRRRPQLDAVGRHGYPSNVVITSIKLDKDRHAILARRAFQQGAMQRGSSNGGFSENGCTQGPDGSAKEISP